MKLLPMRTHGVLDYLTAGTLLVMPQALGWSENVSRLLTTAAVGTIAYSLLTRYELGAFRVLPVETHLALDSLNGLTVATASLWLNEDKRDSFSRVIRSSLVASKFGIIGHSARKQAVPCGKAMSRRLRLL